MQRAVCLLLLESVKWVEADVSDFTTELKTEIKKLKFSVIWFLIY